MYRFSWHHYYQKGEQVGQIFGKSDILK